MDVKQLLQQSGFRFNKQFGQNFLTDNALLEGITSDADIHGGVVLEIGAGAGTLTRALCKHADRVIAFEIDRNLAKILAVTLADCPNVQLCMEDVMKRSVRDIEQMCGAPYSVVANIPYYITTPLLMRFVEEGTNVTSLTLTIQKEVAERLTATAGTKDYGAITVAVDAVADAEITRILSRDLFYPVPNVDSAVVHIAINRSKYDIANLDLFNKTVRCGFQMRRKTLVNNLMNCFKLSRDCCEKLLGSLGLSANVRGEELTTDEYVMLYKKLEEVL